MNVSFTVFLATQPIPVARPVITAASDKLVVRHGSVYIYIFLFCSISRMRFLFFGSGGGVGVVWVSSASAGFIQKIETLFQGLFKDFSRTKFIFQGPSTECNVTGQVK